MTDDEFVWAMKSEGHLITRTAGGSARQMANELRQTAPVRSRVARLLGVHTEERAYRIGADGEETVGSRLDRLGTSEWLVLHDIIRNDRGTNVDHLVIGRAGVFTLNTKHHPRAKIAVTERTFRVNGYRQNYLPVAVGEAKKVGDVLSAQLGFEVRVHAVIVVMGAELDVRTAPPDVAVIRRRDLPKWFERQNPELSVDEAERLMRVAGRPSTWRPSEQLVVRTWNRYGKKRLYVNDATGNTLGYRDEATGNIHVNNEADLERVRRALPT